MTAYYNEIEPYAAQWLRNLIHEGLIAKGDVDERSIKDVTGGDLAGYTQCHFFAGIGGWSLALRLAGWPDDRPVWTGSCPCQPFSIIGRQRKFQDERHLWPEWRRLIGEHKPSVVFGEQVANASAWLDMVFSNLEAQNYACGAAYLPAASVGTRHERQRIWFVADADAERWANAKGVTATQKKADKWPPVGVVDGAANWDIPGAFEPGPNWIVDGLLGEGSAVSALGNAIVPQVAAEFIQAYLECLES